MLAQTTSMESPKAASWWHKPHLWKAHFSAPYSSKVHKDTLSIEHRSNFLLLSMIEDISEWISPGMSSDDRWCQGSLGPPEEKASDSKASPNMWILHQLNQDIPML